MRKKLKRRVPRLPLLYRIIRGGVGQDFVVKHYEYGAIITRFPDMSNIIATALQKKCRNKFKDAVAHAKEVMKDKEAVARIRRRIKKKYRVFNAIIKEYMLREKRMREQEKILVERMLYRAMRGKDDEVEVKVDVDGKQSTFDNSEKVGVQDSG